MGVEIERKFLVCSNLWRSGPPGVAYRQGYLCRDKERTVRVRLAGSQAYLTIKGARSGLSRAEFEYAVPLADAELMLQMCLPPLIEKTRYLRAHGGLFGRLTNFTGTMPDWWWQRLSCRQRTLHSTSLPGRGQKSPTTPGTLTPGWRSIPIPNGEEIVSGTWSSMCARTPNCRREGSDVAGRSESPPPGKPGLSRLVGDFRVLGGVAFFTGGADIEQLHHD